MQFKEDDTVRRKIQRGGETENSKSSKSEPKKKGRSKSSKSS